MGIIFDIQRFSIHDGPGIRTTVFLKGCNNACLWCHNPESLSVYPQIQTYYGKCIGCGACFENCPYGCHTIVTDERGEQAVRGFRRDLCTGCGLCAENCFAKALVLCGEEKTPEEVVKEILMDRSYYEESGGGVTLSGGEPFLQFEFMMAILKALKEHKIHVVVQTALNIAFEKVVEAAPYVDLFMCDLKIWDPKKHKKYIGNDGSRIRENLKRLPELRKLGAEYAVRTPVIGTVNDTEEEIGSIAEFLKQQVQPIYYELMPYHDLGRSKAETLGMTEQERTETVFFTTPSKERMEELNRLINL